MTPADKENQHQLPMRDEAEARLENTPKAKIPARPAETLLHDLQLHQIELETQNEHLRQMQIELEKSRDRYVDFYDFAPVGYITLSQKGLIDEINLTGATLIGAARGKLQHRRFATFVAPEDSERWYRHFIYALEHDQKFSCELVLQKSNGSRFNAQMDCLRLKKDGEKTVVRVVLTDISERKHIEETLRKLSLAVEQSPASVVITDLNACIQYVNPMFTEISGYSAAEVIGKTPRIFQSRQTTKKTYRALWDTIKSGHSWHGELFNKRKNGEFYWEDVHVTPVKDQADTVTHYIAIKTDITERKRAEEKNKVAQEIRVSRAAIRNLAAHIEKQREDERKVIAREVHDELGQILSALRMDVALLKDRTGIDNAVMTGIERDMLTLVDHAIQSVRNVARNLRPMQMNMGTLAAIEWQCAEFTKHNGIPCSLKAVDYLNGMSENNTLVLYRIVQESLTNIARHAAATLVGITIVSRDGATVVKIRDNGKGFDPKTLGSNKSFGLLGMSERAISIAGELNVTSRIGKGTVVTLRIPDDPAGG